MKFQPCGHMHAGIGLVGRISKSPIIESIQSSLYFGTHSGGTFGLVGSAGPAAPTNLAINITSRLDSWLPKKILASDNEGIVEIPSPVIGFNYNLFQRRLSSYVDFQFTAIPAVNGGEQQAVIVRRSVGPISLKLRVGLDYIPTGKDVSLSFHLNASEVTKEAFH